MSGRIDEDQIILLAGLTMKIKSFLTAEQVNTIL